MVNAILSAIFIAGAIALLIIMYVAYQKENKIIREIREKELEFFRKHSK